MWRSFFVACLVFLLAIGTNDVRGENIARGVRVVVIDAGHGGPKYPGASYRGVREKDLNLQVALKLGALIEKNLPQVRVVYTRTTDQQFSENLNRDLQARADIANQAEGDLFISIHTNAAKSTSARGVETLIMGETPLEKSANENALYVANREDLIDMSDQKTAAVVRAYIQNLQFTYGEYSEAMARLVQKHYVAAGRPNRGVKRQPLKVLYATDMPGILTEIGFLSNAEDFAYMTSEKGQNELASALYKAVKDYVDYVAGTLLVEEDAARYEEPDAEPEALQAAPLTSGFTIQLLSGAKSVKLNDPQFRDWRGRVEEFRSEGRFSYKYCVGRYATRAEAAEELKAVRRQFRDAYIVEFEGDRIVKRPAKK